MSIVCCACGSDPEDSATGHSPAALQGAAGDVATTTSVQSADRGGLGGGDWSSAGHDLLNTRSQPAEVRIGRNNASTLTVKWVFQTDGDVWSTTAVADGTVYVTDASGALSAVDAKTGTARWQRKVADYTGLSNDNSRTTPAIAGDVLFIGDQGARTLTTGGAGGAYVIAVRRKDGSPLWVTQVEPHPAAVITQSPVVYGDTVYVGVSSLEEQFAAAISPYKCCSFRGSMVALDRKTGAIRWHTYVLPGQEAPGYAGGAVWGNTPVIDPARNSVYITTGNNYTVPQGILDCQTAGTADQVKSCVDQVPGSKQNYFDSILALDLKTGAIKWGRPMIPFDSWNISCLYAVPGNEGNCTNPKGEDFDFGQGATLLTVSNKGRTRQLLGAGQKSGVYWAVDPSNGNVVWSTQVGPGGSLGGLEWGSATDGRRIYVAVANSAGKPWTLSDGTSTTSGFWSALDAATGKILWQTAGDPVVKSSNQGPVSVANGVVYAGTIDSAGTMYALDANDGKTLWTYRSGGSVNTSPAVVNGVLYWGSGYGVRGIGLKPNNKLYAFVPKDDCRPRGSCVPPAAGSGGAGGAGGASGGGAAGSAGAAPSGPLPTTWSGIYAAYFGPGTLGHCAGCHSEQGRIVPLNSAAAAYSSLTSVGQINGTSSPIAQRGVSRLTWFGGDMPPNGPSSFPEAEQAITAWVAAGAPNN